MKYIYLLTVLGMCNFFSVQAANITAVQNGNWISASTWDLNRAPANNDVVIIPLGRRVYFVNSPYPKNDPAGRPTLDIRIFGILDFSDAGNDKLYLDAGSRIEIFALGRIRTSNNSTEIIAIYNGSTDNTVWTGTPNNINGPAYATATSAGFINGVLPINLSSFEVTASGKSNAKLSWVTESELNSSHFEIELYKSDLNMWKKEGEIKAAGNSNSVLKYSIIIELSSEGLNQFRLKVVDIDGRFKYSPVRSINYHNREAVKLFMNMNSRILQVEGVQNLSNQDMQLAIYDLNGREVLHKKLTPGKNAVYLSIPGKGIYIARILKDNRTLLTRKIAVQ